MPTETIFIEVTQDHISEGVRTVTGCPVTLAVYEYFKEECDFVLTGWGHVLLRKVDSRKDEGIAHKTFQHGVKNWLIAFDAGRPVRPFTLRLWRTLL